MEKNRIKKIVLLLTIEVKSDILNVSILCHILGPDGAETPPVCAQEFLIDRRLVFANYGGKGERAHAARETLPAGFGGLLFFCGKVSLG